MDKTFFDWLDFIASNVLLPLGGLLIVAFVGWYLGREKTETEVTNEGELKAGYLPLFMFLTLEIDLSAADQAKSRYPRYVAE